MNKIKVSIFCLTYNHKEYIRDALDGFLMQKTDFRFNIFIFDDASDDGTSDIVKEYEEKYPHIIKAYVSPVNTYQKTERVTILNELFEKYIIGEYVAWCEGDDAWNDENKLQLQVDFLESNPECVMTTHSFDILDCSNGKKYTKTFGNESRYLTSDEVILQPNGNLSTASLVMRNDVFLLKGFPSCDVMDYPMQLCAISKGKIYYINKNMCVYRYMHTGSWCKDVFDNQYKRMLHDWGMVAFLKKYDYYTECKFHGIVYQKLCKYLSDITFSYENLSYTQYARLCDDVYQNKQLNKQYLKKQLEVFRYIKGEYFFSGIERKYIENFKHIVIMGHGKFSKYIECVLEKNQINYDGYIVTSLEPERKNINNIWELREYPFRKKDTLVIIGISQVYEDAVRVSLEQSGFENQYTPLWLNE